tara:strand:+ start:280 stop:528 length:249 start_codon:yes stop_codon:yes gene_type:complete
MKTINESTHSSSQDVEKWPDETLVENAVLAFLHHYPSHNKAEDYKDLLKRIQDGQYPLPKAQGRRRPAKRQRKAQASKDTAS